MNFLSQKGLFNVIKLATIFAVGDGHLARSLVAWWLHSILLHGNGFLIYDSSSIQYPISVLGCCLFEILYVIRKLVFSFWGAQYFLPFRKRIRCLVGALSVLYLLICCFVLNSFLYNTTPACFHTCNFLSFPRVEYLIQKPVIALWENRKPSDK